MLPAVAWGKPRVAIVEFEGDPGGELSDTVAELLEGDYAISGPSQVWRTVVAHPKTTPEDKAYALSRAVRCYAPAQINSCGGEDVPQEQRKAWFQQLKKRYPNSKWAKELQGYW